MTKQSSSRLLKKAGVKHLSPNYDKEAMTIQEQWSKHSLFNNWCWNTRYPHAKTINLDTDLRLFTKIN